MYRITTGEVHRTDSFHYPAARVNRGYVMSKLRNPIFDSLMPLLILASAHVSLLCAFHFKL